MVRAHRRVYTRTFEPRVGAHPSQPIGQTLDDRQICVIKVRRIGIVLPRVFVAHPGPDGIVARYGRTVPLYRGPRVIHLIPVLIPGPVFILTVRAAVIHDYIRHGTQRACVQFPVKIPELFEGAVCRVKIVQGLGHISRAIQRLARRWQPHVS